MSFTALKSSQLYTITDPNEIGYSSTADVDTSKYNVIGQSRALEAIEFGVGMRRNNYNLYLAGSKGLGKHSVMQHVLEQQVGETDTPSDWCYVDNYEAFFKPLSLQLPAGMGLKLRADMAKLVEDLIIAIPSAYESDEYRSRSQEIEELEEEERETAFQELGERALKQDINLLQTPTGYTLVPMSGDKPIERDDLDKLPKKKKKEIQNNLDILKEDLKVLVLKVPEWQKKTREAFKELNTYFSKTTVDQFITPLTQKYSALPDIQSHLENVRKDIILNIHNFLPKDSLHTPIGGQTIPPPPELARYEINVLVNNSDLNGAPIIYENNPTYNNLLGKIEHVAQDGALISDFTLIKAGALHRANGGYLVIDVHKLLLNPFAWDGLKRTLYAQKIRIESLDQMLSLVSTISLEPEPIPLDIKVVLVGDRFHYYLLKTYDPEFSELFKATADFSESFDRDSESVKQLALLTSAVAIKEKVRPIINEGVARIVEQCSRETGDSEKLSLHLGQLKDLVLEADYWAGKEKQKNITAEHVQKAIDARVHRANQIHEQMKEQILRDIVLIDTDGTCSGQVNGLSVFQLGDYSFGQPSRITATARLGHGNVMDIEREIKLGGPIHSKGVMILSSCLANRYARNRPLSVAATLVFEQNYGGVDGDSASIAEFSALVSALADIPIKQCFAVTGSINQHGDAQAIGGVNQKIEGFFDICKERGLTGSQGVIIPAANTNHLMLHRDVVEAVSKNKFHVHTVDKIDDALELLMGLPIGESNTDGNYPEGTINYLIMQRLDELHQFHKDFANSEKEHLNAENTNTEAGKQNGG